MTLREMSGAILYVIGAVFTFGGAFNFFVLHSAWGTVNLLVSVFGLIMIVIGRSVNES